MNLRYEFARLRTEYYLRGIQDDYHAGNTIFPPNYVIWDCTRRCNLHCHHCGATKESYTWELTTPQIKGILDELAMLKIDMFAVTGGEPLLRKDLFNVLEYAHKQGLRTGIATNGFLVNQATARCIKDAGVHSVQVSLDGLEKTHNRIRGNDLSYERAVDALERLTKLNIPLITVATTIMMDNISEIEKLKIILLQMGVKLWRLAIVMPIGRARSRAIIPSAGQLTALFKFIEANNSQELRINIGENLPFLGKWERSIRNAPVICPIGFTACCIGVDGNVRGCPEQADVHENREGSLLDQSFSSIWNTGFRRYRTRVILETDPDCAGCKSKFACYGGCWVMRSEKKNCFNKLFLQTTMS